MDRLVLPNYHAIIIHFPLALLLIGVVIELLACRRCEGSIRSAGRWMILLGVLALPPTITSGLFALHDVAAHGNDGSWADARATLSAGDWTLVRRHLLCTLTGSGLALLAVVAFVGACDTWRARLRWPVLAALVLAMLTITLGAWQGGEMVFRNGMAVEGREGVLPADAQRPSGWREEVDYLVSPLQVHVILAGVVVSLTALGFALAMRKASVIRDAEAALMRAMSARPAPAAPADPVAEYALRPQESGSAAGSGRVCLPCAGATWALVAAAALVTGLAGLYVGGYFTWPKVLDWQTIASNVKEIHWPDAGRQGLHVVGAGAILVLPLILAGLARWGPRQRIAMVVVFLLLLAVVAVQVWMGVLMLYDGPMGPINAFTRAGG